MRYQYYFYIRTTQPIRDFLKQNKIKHKLGDNNDAKVSICSSQDNHQELVNTLSSTYACGKPHVYCDYSAEDLDEAEYLWITPCKHCIEIKNGKEAHQYSCEYIHKPTGLKRACHRKQVSTFQITRIPKLNTKTAFYAQDTGADALFADYRIKAMTEKHQLQGLLFQPILLRNKKESEEIFQLTSSHMMDMTDGSVPNMCIKETSAERSNGG